MQEYGWLFTREYPPELRREPGLTESTAVCHKKGHSLTSESVDIMFCYLFESSHQKRHPGHPVNHEAVVSTSSGKGSVGKTTLNSLLVYTRSSTY